MELNREKMIDKHVHTESDIPWKLGTLHNKNVIQQQKIFYAKTTSTCAAAVGRNDKEQNILGNSSPLTTFWLHSA